MSRGVRRAAAFIAAAAAATGSAAQQRESLRPLWEAGAGGTVLTLPHYRGSDQSRTWLLPLPYFVYRGKFLRADREGARAVLLDRDNVEVDLSVAGSAPARSGDNEARQGMPNLAPVFEIGPNMNVLFGRGPDWKVELRAPVRAAFTLESRTRHVGWTASPYVTAEWRQAGWDVGVRLGALWGDRRYHAYVYDVAPAYATPTRPAYEAKAGSGGWQSTVGASRRFGRLWVGTFARVDDVGQAVFEPSPLVRQRRTVAYGLAASWVFGQSETLVSVPD